MTTAGNSLLPTRQPAEAVRGWRDEPQYTHSEPAYEEMQAKRQRAADAAASEKINGSHPSFVAMPVPCRRRSEHMFAALQREMPRGVAGGGAADPSERGA